MKKKTVLKQKKKGGREENLKQTLGLGRLGVALNPFLPHCVQYWFAKAGGPEKQHRK